MAKAWVTEGPFGDTEFFMPDGKKDASPVDWVFCYKTRETITKVKGTKYAYYYPDMREELSEVLVDHLKDYDLLLLNNEGSIKMYEEELPHLKVVCLKQAADPTLYQVPFLYDPEKPLFSWLFAGSPYRGRELFVEALMEIKGGALFGYGWDKVGIRKEPWKKTEIYNVDLALQVLRSRFTLNYNIFSNIEGSFSCRVYKTMACGGVLLTNRSKGMDQIFTKGTHYLEFKELGEMRAMINSPLYYWEYETLQNISENARKEVVEHHTYRHRGEELCQILKDF